jgi:hypothetical protein
MLQSMLLVGGRDGNAHFFSVKFSHTVRIVCILEAVTYSEKPFAGMPAATMVPK